MSPLTFLLPFLCVVGAVRWTEFPTETSGLKNLHSLSASSFVSFLQSSNLSVVWFHPKTINASHMQNLIFLRDSVLTVVADRLGDVPVAEFPTTDETNAITRALHVNSSEVDTIHIYLRLRKIVYHGLRTPDVLINFIKKLSCPSFPVIGGKVDKKLFDLVDKTRVLSFVIPGSHAAANFANASRFFVPKLPFYVVTDEVVARHMKLPVGSVHLFRAGYQQSSAELPKPTSDLDIKLFIENELRKPSFHLRRMIPENIHAVWLERPSEPKLVLLTYSNDPRSNQLRKLVKHSIKNDTDCEVSVIEVDRFPGMTEYWQQHFGVKSVGKPKLGLVSFENSSAIWFDNKVLNSSDLREAEHQNQVAISDFIDTVLNGTISFGSPIENRQNPDYPLEDSYEPSKDTNPLDGDKLDLTQLRLEAMQGQRADVKLGKDDAEGGSHSDVGLAQTKKRSESTTTEQKGSKTIKEAVEKFEHDLTSFGQSQHDPAEF